MSRSQYKDSVGATVAADVKEVVMSMHWAVIFACMGAVNDETVIVDFAQCAAITGHIEVVNDESEELDSVQMLYYYTSFSHTHYMEVQQPSSLWGQPLSYCLLYTSDAADERSSVDLGGRRII